jgi:hypothetical protein
MAEKATPTKPPATAAPPAVHAGRLPSARPSSLLDTRVVHCRDNLEQLAKLPHHCVDLIYIDPPFNSNRNYEVYFGETQERRPLQHRHAFTHAYVEYMRPRCVQLARVLKKTVSAQTYDPAVVVVKPSWNGGLIREINHEKDSHLSTRPAGRGQDSQYQTCLSESIETRNFALNWIHKSREFGEDRPKADRKAANEVIISIDRALGAPKSRPNRLRSEMQSNFTKPLSK